MSSSPSARRPVAVLSSYAPAALFLLCFSGCGGNAYDVVGISGKVTYEDGSLIPGEMIAVTFVSQEKPIDRKTHPRLGRAEVNVADGTFDTVSTYEYGDGAIAGKHKVVLRCIGENEAPTDAVPPEYTDPATTPLTIDVNGERWFELKITRPPN